MQKSVLVLLLTVFCALFNFGVAEAKQKQPAGVDAKKCFECHDTVKTLHNRGAHKGVNCIECHTVKNEHITAPSAANRPTVSTDHRTCAKCHEKELKDMLDTKYHMAWASKRGQVSYSLVRQDDDTFKGVQSRFPRYHVGILADITVNRMGGRYEYKDGYSEAVPVERLWDAVKDVYPEDGNEMIRTRPSTAWRPQKMKGIAKDAFCLKCKSADNILDYSYMSRSDVGAPVNMQSPIYPAIKKMQNSFNCIFCHDPHSGQPRVVNDILIDGMTNPEYKDNEYQKNVGKTMPKAEIVTMGARGYERKVAILERPDSNFMCGQCHMSFHTAVTLKDRDTGKEFSGKVFGNLTSTLFRKGPLETQEYYKKNNLYNKVYPATGTKYAAMEDHAQLEIVSQSIHGKSGVGCTDCHFAKAGKGHMEHQPSLPMEKVDKTCLRSDCHGAGTKFNWKKPEQALYQISAIQQKSKNQLSYLSSYRSQVVDYMKAVKDGKISTSNDAYAGLENALERALTVESYWQTDYSNGMHNPKLLETSVFTSMNEMKKALETAKKSEKK
jgi:formate-dependent nitrite reductase cytochrome c552 subunit